MLYDGLRNWFTNFVQSANRVQTLDLFISDLARTQKVCLIKISKVPFLIRTQVPSSQIVQLSVVKCNNYSARVHSFWNSWTSHTG